VVKKILHQCSAPAGQHWSARPPLSKKSFESDHEIMQDGIICLNLVEKNVGTAGILGRTLPHLERFLRWGRGSVLGLHIGVKISPIIDHDTVHSPPFIIHGKLSVVVRLKLMAKLHAESNIALYPIGI
jgi:hypothetical protein